MTWQLERANAFEWLAEVPRKGVDHVVIDPPYDAHVHAKVRSGRNLGDTTDFSCRARRAVELGFDSINADDIDELARQYARIAKRWVLIFSNVELASTWREALVRHGLDYVRTGAWHKLRATPQFSGDRPAAAFEAITIAHPRGRKKWNGGGSHALWSHPVVANCAGHRRDRVHTTQKPLSLMLELVQLFTDPGDLILDSHAGSGTTGVAALRLGRRFIGCEIQQKYVTVAKNRLAAEMAGLSATAFEDGQLPLFSQ